MDDHEPRMTGEKLCRICGVEKPVIAFAVSKRNRDGLQSYCRECGVEMVRASPSYRKQRDRTARRKQLLSRMSRYP